MHLEVMAIGVCIVWPYVRSVKREKSLPNQSSTTKWQSEHQSSSKLNQEEIQFKLKGEPAGMCWLPIQKSASIKTCAEAQLCGDLWHRRQLQPDMTQKCLSQVSAACHLGSASWKPETSGISMFGASFFALPCHKNRSQLVIREVRWNAVCFQNYVRVSGRK